MSELHRNLARVIYDQARVAESNPEKLAAHLVREVAAHIERARKEDRHGSYAHQSKGHAARWLRAQVEPS